jgi:hypothetical protein
MATILCFADSVPEPTARAAIGPHFDETIQFAVEYAL